MARLPGPRVSTGVGEFPGTRRPGVRREGRGHGCGSLAHRHGVGQRRVLEGSSDAHPSRCCGTDDPDESRIGVLMRRREPIIVRRPLVVADDLRALVEIPLLAMISIALPQRRWEGACRAIERVKSMASWREPRAAAAAVAAMLGAGPATDDADRFAIGYAACRIEQYMQGLRECLPGGWRPRIVLDGGEWLAAALAGGRGAVVWVAPFVFAPLAAKRALAEAGASIAHVSRPGHGFTRSRFGVAVLNPIRVAAENRWLIERLVIEDAHAGAVMMRAQRVLRANRVVSITAGGWEGQRLATVRIFGRSTELALGAPGLARITGAPLLPVFTVRDPDGTLRVVVDAPIPIASDRPRDTALDDAAQVYADRVEPWIRRYPMQWRNWLELGEAQ